MEIRSLAVGVATVVLLVSSFVLMRWRSSRRLPPGSMGLPLIGETLQFFAPGSLFELSPFVSSRLKRYGTIFKTSLLGSSVVFSADEEFNQMAFQQEGKLFQSCYPESFNKIIGKHNLQAQHGFVFKYLKSIIHDFVGHQTLKEVLIGEFEKAARTSLRLWAEHPSVELREATFAMTFNLAATKLMSYEESSSLLEDLRKNVFAFIQGLFSFPVYIPGTSFYKSLKGRKDVMKILKKTLKTRMNSPELRYGDFWDKLVEELTKNDPILTESMALDLAIAMLFASSETTSQSIILAFKLLAEHQEVIKKLEEEQEEIMKKVGERQDSKMTWEDYKSMQFTSQVITEILRLGSIAPGILRKVMKNIEYKGYTIPEGWHVMVCTQAVHLNPRIYEEPLSFNPSRWKEKSAGDFKHFMAFGGGMRFCVGADYNLLFMSIFLHCLITKYRWKIIKGGTITRSFGLEFPEDFNVQLIPKA
ncbi:cytochrome P450 family protein [Rhynchospora pubera]|uniref:Cytochrome P450 family protein n=1 Tax=Rhynchospora pubera TaxID=906938 RepID=A0AAV8G5A2_9POAL|nr:cytochrome P450 family protein [Rhynchospora pubera]